MEEKRYLKVIMVCLFMVSVISPVSPELTERIKKRISELTSNKGYPVLFNANIGHVDPIITLRYGSMASLDSFKDEFKII